MSNPRWNGGQDLPTRSPRSFEKDSKAAEMLPSIAQLFRERGAESFSLAEIAGELGTSSRMLIYHFGSRDELLGRVLNIVRRETIAILSDPPPDQVGEAIQRWWDYYSAREHLADMQLFFHLASRSFEEPESFTDFTSTAVVGWADFFARAIEGEGVEAEAADSLARLAIAAMRGIMVDYLITADLESAERSVEAFRELMMLQTVGGQQRQSSR